MWFFKLFFICLVGFPLLCMLSCGGTEHDAAKHQSTADEETLSEKESETEDELLNDPDSVIYHLWRGYDQNGEDIFDPTIRLVLNKGQYAFIGEGEDYLFLVRYLKSKRGNWDLIPFSDAEDNYIFYVDGFSVTFQGEEKISITSSPLTSDTYTFIRIEED